MVRDGDLSSPDLIVRHLTKRFSSDSTTITAVSDVSFKVTPGEFFTMLGPSGCGKTTTLRMIAGLETVSSGEISLNGQDYTSVPARQRNIGMVFQSYALFPHLSVFDNVAYGLQIRNIARSEIAVRVDETLSLLGLDALAKRLPGQLSGGQQQRVSLARALVYRPQLLLLDEPLANLDAKLRVQMREEIRRVQRTLGIMVIYVTHDQEEAMAISDRIAVFNHGRLIQVDAPVDTYARPKSLFVADFIGHANFIPVSNANGVLALPSGQPIEAGLQVSVPAIEMQGFGGADGVLMIRPESFEPVHLGGAFRGIVARVQHLGAHTRYMIVSDGFEKPIMMDISRAAPELSEGAMCQIGYSSANATLFVASGQ